MSWEAVTWASKQAMKLPQEQLVLLVLANCADPDGVAFSEWRGREHWWKYLVRRTRLSKSSLFRHINTLLDLGLCTRSELVLADGTKRPTIHLDLTSSFDYEEIRSYSHGETENDEADDEAENTHDISVVQDGINSPAIQSHGGTGPTGGNDVQPSIPASGTQPFPIVGTHIDSSISSSKESPPTPQRGAAPDDGFEDFKKVWARPIERVSVAQTAWSHVATGKRGEALTAARGYWAWLSRQTTKPPPPMSAQTFLRESSGWAQWLAYAPDADGAPASIVNAHPVKTPQAEAITLAYQLAGASDFLRSTMTRNGAVNYLRPVTPRLLALAHAPMSGWVQLSRQQAAAWEEFLREVITVAVRKHLKEGDRAPWSWPPRKDGTLSTAGPAETLMDEDEMADFK